MRDFKHSVNVLVRAYMNDTLEHFNCYACAVGNLVSDAMGYEYKKCVDSEAKRIAWKHNEGRYYQTVGSPRIIGGDWYLVVLNDEYKIEGIKEIEATGYSIDEVTRIENAFESAGRIGDFMLNGLMAVVDVLADIHQIDLTVREETKKLFVKA
jgi:hypothetical protein